MSLTADELHQRLDAILARRDAIRAKAAQVRALLDDCVDTELAGLVALSMGVTLGATMVLLNMAPSPPPIPQPYAPVPAAVAAPEVIKPPSMDTWAISPFPLTSEPEKPADAAPEAVQADPPQVDDQQEEDPSPRRHRRHRRRG